MTIIHLLWIFLLLLASFQVYSQEQETHQLIASFGYGTIQTVDWDASGQHLIIYDADSRQSQMIIPTDGLILLWSTGIVHAQSDTHWQQLTRGQASNVSVYGDFIAVGGEQGIYIYDHDFHDVAFLPAGFVRDLAWNDTGTQLAVTSAHGEINHITIWDVLTANQMHIVEAESRSGDLLDWRGDWLAASRDIWTLNDPIITIWHTETMEVIAHLPPPPQAQFPRLATSLAWHPEGDYLAIGFGDIYVWDMAAMAYTHHFPEPSNGVYFDVRWHVDGRRIAAGTSSGAVHILSLDDAPLITLNLPSETPVIQVTWMDDNILAAATRDGFLQFWDVATETPLTNEAHALVNEIRMLVRLDDERLLMLGGDSFQIISLDCRQLSAYYGHVMNPYVAWSADGRFIINWPQATASEDAVIIAWDAQTATPVCAVSPIRLPLAS